MKPLRFDLVFSYWIIFWYILYILKLTTYSPKLLLLLGIIENLIILFLMFIKGSNKKTIITFIIINFFIKVLPYISLQREKINKKDIIASFIYFIIYIIWIKLNNQSLYGNTKMIYESLIKNQNKTPFLHLLDKIFEKN